MNEERTPEDAEPSPDRDLYKRVEPKISEDELRRREQEGGRPLAEILEDLRKLR